MPSMKQVREITVSNFNQLHFEQLSEAPFESYHLSNGIRIVHQRIYSPVAYCAIMMNAGSRDEAENENGAAHLVEHLIFKQTGKRKAHHIFYERALELFYDIIFNHRFTDKILQLEKSVVIDEIKSSKDNPSELIFDEFDCLLFPDHPLGRRTLGVVQSVNRLSISDLERFVARNYNTGQIVISSVGNISFQRLIAYAEKYFGKIAVKPQTAIRTSTAGYVSFHKESGKKNHQSHCIIGVSCSSVESRFRIAMLMLANLLGGPGMNTRLNMSLRERYGLVYHVEASYTPYSDVGVFQIYFASDRSRVEKCIHEIEKELDRLKKNPLTKEQLRKLQLQVMGQLAIASDNNEARMLSAAKSILMFDRIDNMHDIYTQITEVNDELLCEIANSVFCNLSFLMHY